MKRVSNTLYIPLALFFSIISNGALLDYAELKASEARVKVQSGSFLRAIISLGELVSEHQNVSTSAWFAELFPSTHSIGFIHVVEGASAYGTHPFATIILGSFLAVAIPITGTLAISKATVIYKKWRIHKKLNQIREAIKTQLDIDELDMAMKLIKSYKAGLVLNQSIHSDWPAFSFCNTIFQELITLIDQQREYIIRLGE
jgi:hypothetical protein